MKTTKHLLNDNTGATNKPVRQVVHGLRFPRWTERLTDRPDCMVIPKLSVLIKLFLKDAQEHIPYKALVFMGAVEVMSLSQVTE